MDKKITSDSNSQTNIKLQPKRKTLQTILAFAAAYHVEQLVDGELLQFFLN